jgi:hypothetical protein
MFIVESESSRAARKMSYLMFIVLLLTVPGALLVMHFYIRPRPPSAPGWRIFGFPRRGIR